MYKDFYHMLIEPFGTLPSPDIFFTSETHQAAWDYLVEGMDSQEPSLLVTGAHGTGKSLLSLMLVRELTQQNSVPFVYNPVPNCSYRLILKDVARLLDISATSEDESAVQYEIYKQFRESTLRIRCWLIFDDIQDMDASTLTKIFNLTNFNHTAFFPFRLVLFGHPSAVEMLSSLRRDTMNHYRYRQYRLTPLDQYEIEDYIYYRLLAADAPGIPAFTAEAIQRIYSLSRGIPLLINSICASCLRLGATKKLVKIDLAIVDEAVGQNHDVIAISRKAEAPEKIKLNTSASDEEDSTPPVIPFSSDKGRTTQAVPILSSTRLPSVLLIIVIIVGVFCAALLIRREMANALIDAENKTSEIKSNIPFAAAPGRRHESSLKTEKNQRVAPVQEKHEAPRDETPASGAYPGPATASPARKVFPSAPLTAAVTAILNTRALMQVSDTAMQPAPAQHPYALQLACYTSEAGTREKYRFIKNAGLSPYMVKNISRETGETLWVIYSGWYKSAEDAEKSRNTLHLDGAIAARVPYAVLIGTYPSAEEMSAMRENLEQLGYYPYALPGSPGALCLYAGAFTTRPGAEQLYRQLQEGGIKSQVVLR